MGRVARAPSSAKCQLGGRQAESNPPKQSLGGTFQNSARRYQSPLLAYSRLPHMSNSTITLFGEAGFADWEMGRMRDLAVQIKGEDENYMLNVNESQYLEHLVSSFGLDPLVFYFDSTEATDEERMIPAEQFPPMSFVSRGGRYLKQVFTFHIPVSGHSVCCAWRRTPDWLGPSGLS